MANVQCPGRGADVGRPTDAFSRQWDFCIVPPCIGEDVTSPSQLLKFKVLRKLLGAFRDICAQLSIGTAQLNQAQDMIRCK